MNQLQGVKASTLLLSFCLGLFPTAASAELKAGDVAPDFTVQAAQGGKEFKFSLAEALKKGPVVALLLSKIIHEHLLFLRLMNLLTTSKISKARVRPSSGFQVDKIEVQREFSAKECRDKFPVGADPSLSVTKAYDAVFRNSAVGRGLC